MTPSTIHVLLAGAETLACRGLHMTLSEAPDIDVVDVASDVIEIGATIGHWQPDVVICGHPTAERTVAELAIEIQARMLRARLMVLCSSTQLAGLEAMLKAGVLGFLLADETPQASIEAVQAVSRGEQWFSPRLAAETATWALHRTETLEAVIEAQLTEREREILALLCQGLRNREMAGVLCVTEGTIRNHVSNIYVKLGVTSRCQAILKAHEAGLVAIGNGDPP